MTKDGLKLDIDACELRIETIEYRIKNSDAILEGSIEHGSGGDNYWHKQKIKEMLGLPERLRLEKDNLVKLQARYDKIICFKDVDKPIIPIVYGDGRLDAMLEKLQNTMARLISIQDIWELDTLCEKSIIDSGYRFNDCDDVDLCQNCLRFYDISRFLGLSKVNTLCSPSCEDGFYSMRPAYEQLSFLGANHE